MTYWGYHLIFTIPVLLLLAWMVRRIWKPAHWVATLVVCAIVMTFTTPWDNYAVYLGVWGFGADGREVSLGYPFAHLRDELVWLGHIPFEEYSFFIIESLMVIFLAAWMLDRAKRRRASNGS